MQRGLKNQYSCLMYSAGTGPKAGGHLGFQEAQFPSTITHSGTLLLTGGQKHKRLPSALPDDNKSVPSHQVSGAVSLNFELSAK